VAIGCPADKVEILRSGIDLNRFRKRQFCHHHDPLRLISIGRLSKNKGVQYSISAVRQLVDGGLNVDYCIYGDGPYAGALRQTAHELGLDSVIRFEGRVDSQRIVSELSEADILIAPSITGEHGEQEGLPNTLKEAMAIGVPAIGTSTGGIPELIEHGKTGFLVAEKDPEAIANQVREIANRWESMEELTERARLRIDCEYDLEKLNSRTEQMYATLVGRPIPDPV
jgi:colanic acid/amylovoran biosynthesis glycosyltransferase